MTPIPQTIRLSEAMTQCVALGLPRLEAQMLVLLALGRSTNDRAWLLSHDTDVLPLEAHQSLQALTQRRLGGEPMAYLTGRKEFFGLMLQIDARVLDPRADTEILVDWSLECLQPLQCPRVLDLGTGSGAIALAIQSQRPDAQVDAVDASAAALAVAQANAHQLGLPVHFKQSDWLAGQDTDYALIASNPPYIAEDDPHLLALTHEPRQALTSGTRGMSDLLHIIAQAPAHLQSGGWLLLEHGWNQGPEVRQALQTAGFLQVNSRRDLAGHERCTGGRRLGR